MKEQKQKQKQKKCSTLRLSQRVYKRDFCSDVFANPDMYLKRGLKNNNWLVN